MYLHLGSDTIIRTEEIVGIFDLDNSTVSLRTREYLARAEKQGKIVNVSSELPKSFVICREREGERIYICQLSPITLMKRVLQNQLSAE